MTAQAKQRILVVDDEPQVLVAVGDLLDEEFEVEKTDSAEKALRLASERDDFAVVISDQRMPRMTGEQLFSNLSQCSRATRILVTGYADLNDVVRAVNNGNIFAYVTKPWNPEDFRLMVRKGVDYFKMAADLRDSEERLQLMFRGSGAGLFDWNIESDQILYSQSFGALLGWDGPDGTTGRRELRERIHADDRKALRSAIRAHLAERAPLNNLELRVCTTDGSYRWFLVSGQAVWNNLGQATRLAGSITDITIRKRQEERITRLTRVHAMRGGISSAIVRFTDRGALLKELCRTAIGVGHFSLAVAFSAQAAGDGLEVIAAEPADHPFVKLLRQARAGELPAGYGAVLDALDTGRPVVVEDLRRSRGQVAGGQPPWAACAAFPLLVEGRPDSVFVLFSESPGSFDAEEEKLLAELADNLAFALGHIRQVERIDHITYYDTLTALPNRHLLRDRLTQRIAASGPGDKFGLLLIDVSRFRHVNETFGWATGDALLTQIAERLISAIEPPHTLARLSGNTFAIVFGAFEDPAEVAVLVEDGLTPCLKQPFELPHGELRVALRSGIALYPADGRSADALIGNAETALRSAKSAGHSYRFYAPHMNAHVAEKLTLETKLRRAIDAEEFLLHYQPKVDMKSGQIVGLEALVRWREPSGTLVPPGHFIPLLEETGLIVDAGRWILHRAAAQHESWLQRGLTPPRIAVNVSAGQLAQADFVAMVAEVLARFPRAAQGLDLEITESVFVDNLTDNAEKLRAVRQRGLMVAIDDFGTGYSSLGYLSRLPIDALKIDRSFVVRMFDSAEDMAIVSTIISLAHSLDLKVIAEGVETPQQAQHLRLLRCDQLQGYLTAKPQPAEEVERLFGETLLTVQRRA